MHKCINGQKVDSGFIFAVILNVTEEEIDDLINGDLRSKIVNRKRKMESTASELEATQEALARVEREMEELKNEMKKIRSGASEKEPCVRFALGFTPSEFNAMNYTRGLSWVSDTLAVKMKEMMSRHEEYFQKYLMLGDIGPMEFKVCARYNRGDECHHSWHVLNKQSKKGKVTTREIRLHCCALCLASIGIAAGHQLINCPWVLAETWTRIENKQEI